MADRAQVTSVETLESFRSSLIVYAAKARPVVEEASSLLRRTLLWLDTEQRARWEREVVRRTRMLEEAQQALLSARLSSFKDTAVMEQTAVHAARRSLAEAQEKLQLVRRWAREFGPRTETAGRLVEALDSTLAQEVPRAIAFLTAIITHLTAYLEKDSPPAPLAAVPSTEPTEATPMNPAPEEPAP